jgi:hypothetical protein
MNFAPFKDTAGRIRLIVAFRAIFTKRDSEMTNWTHAERYLMRVTALSGGVFSDEVAAVALATAMDIAKFEGDVA